MTGDLVGSSAILEYLRVAHRIDVCRQTLNKYRHRDDPFPARTEMRGWRMVVVADRSAVDVWAHRWGDTVGGLRTTRPEPTMVGDHAPESPPRPD